MNKSSMKAIIRIAVLLSVVTVIAPNITILLSAFILLIIVFFLETKRVWYIGVLLLTYAVLAPTFAMEVLMFNEDKTYKSSWFKDRYTYEMFKIEFYIFLPIILLFNFLFFSYGKKSKRFSRKEILSTMKELLK